MTKKTFKVGQEVEVINRDDYRFGQRGVVRHYIPNDASGLPYTVKFDKDQESYFAAHELMRVKEPKARKAPNGPQTYRGNGEHDWEHVISGAYTITTRLRVPGGWLYRVVDANNNSIITRVMSFVPAPEAIGYKV